MHQTDLLTTALVNLTGKYRQLATAYVYVGTVSIYGCMLCVNLASSLVVMAAHIDYFTDCMFSCTFTSHAFVFLYVAAEKAAKPENE